MSQADEFNRKFRLVQDGKKAEHEDEEGGEGGKSGQIEPHLFIGGESLRDDLLSGVEKRRLLIVHESAHEAVVKKQKETRDQRNNKLSSPGYDQGLVTGIGSQSQYPNHPTLHDKIQFVGIDKQVNNLPTEMQANTNNDKREELKLAFRPGQALRYDSPTLHR